MTASAGLPPLIRRYLDRALPSGAVPAQVQLTQEGEMRKAPGVDPQRFTATQHIAVDRVAFTWKARFPLIFPLKLHVTDRFADGEGHLEVRLFGRVTDRQEGPQTSAGEALRYLAELPWAPHAMVHNPALTWRAVDDHAVEVSTALDGRDLVVRFDFDDAGDIVRASSQMRQRESDQGWMTMPWGGEYRDHQTFGGMRIPTRAQVYWAPPEGRFVYWQATITAVATLAEPFAGPAAARSFSPAG